jgi:hypothetical protein
MATLYLVGNLAKYHKIEDYLTNTIQILKCSILLGTNPRCYMVITRIVMPLPRTEN